MKSFEDYIRKSALTKEDVDTFLSPDEPTWARFDPEVGYVLGNFMPRDGLDGCLTISTSHANGARRSAVYAGRPCRINTYGNSFTQCHQVSDHETWQEYLAAHLGEPIRNFGMGGFGFYQSYRRMVRTEQTADAAENVLLYLWGDDHYRSCLRCRHALTYPWWDHAGGRLLHGNFWSNLEVDLDSGGFVEKPQVLPTPESLYRMTDPEWMVEALRDDAMLQMMAYCGGSVANVDLALVNRVAEALGVPAVPAGPLDETRERVGAVRDACAFSASEWVIDRALAFAEARGKKLMFILLCPRVTRDLLHGKQRYEQRVADYLAARGARVFDMNLVHLQDYRHFKPDPDAYLGRYFIGHYSPAGNHFFAFAIKNALVEMLDPKPLTYREDEQARIDFRGYLPG